MRALFQKAEIDSDLTGWGAGCFYGRAPDALARAIYYGVDSADDPANPMLSTEEKPKHRAKSGAAQFAEFFEMAATEEEEERLVQSFMINL
jgi:hypothetical protein